MSYKFKLNPITGKLDLVSDIDSSSGDLRYLKLDQTTPQTVTAGKPIFDAGIRTASIWNEAFATEQIDLVNGIIYDPYINIPSIGYHSRTLKRQVGVGGNETSFDWANLKFPTLTDNGFLKTSGSDGTLSVDTATYLTSLSGALLADGTVPLTADWAMGAFDITGGVDATFSGTIQAEHLKTTDDLEVADDILLGSGSVINFDSGNATITHSAGVLTFNVFPVTPSAAPDADYEVANKKYVDDNAGGDVVFGVGYFVDQSGGTGDTHGALSGDVNGANTTYTVSKGEYISGTLKVYLNGQLQIQGSSEDWVENTPASGTFDFNTAPQTGDQITAVYQVSGVLFFHKYIEGAYWDNQTICLAVAPSNSAITLTKVQATTIGSSTPTLTYNIEERAYASYNSAGTDIFAADKTADENGDEQTSFSNAGIAASAGLFLTTGAAAESGTVTGLVVYIEYTYG